MRLEIDCNTKESDTDDAVEGACHGEEEDDVGIKVVVVGNGAVGKSSLIRRYCCGTFRNTYSRTIGADFLEKRTRVDGHRVQLMVWDTAGQEEFATITRAYYRGAAVCVIAFSSTDPDSLAAVRRWHTKIFQECGSIPTVLVQTKVDLLGEKHVNVTESDVVETTKDLDMKLFKTSSLENHNIEAVFSYLAEQYLYLISKEAPIVSLSRDMFGAADKLQRGDTILLSSNKKRKRLKLLNKSNCFIV